MAPIAWPGSSFAQATSPPSVLPMEFPSWTRGDESEEEDDPRWQSLRRRLLRKRAMDAEGVPPRSVRRTQAKRDDQKKSIFSAFSQPLMNALDSTVNVEAPSTGGGGSHGGRDSNSENEAAKPKQASNPQPVPAAKPPAQNPNPAPVAPPAQPHPTTTVQDKTTPPKQVAPVQPAPPPNQKPSTVPQVLPTPSSPPTQTEVANPARVHEEMAATPTPGNVPPPAANTNVATPSQPAGSTTESSSTSPSVITSAASNMPPAKASEQESTKTSSSPLPPSAASPTSTSNSIPTVSSAQPGNQASQVHHDLSHPKAEKAMIAVGTIGGTIIFVLLGWFIWRLVRRRREGDQDSKPWAFPGWRPSAPKKGPSFHRLKSFVAKTVSRIPVLRGRLGSEDGAWTNLGHAEPGNYDEKDHSASSVKSHLSHATTILVQTDFVRTSYHGDALQQEQQEQQEQQQRLQEQFRVQEQRMQEHQLLQEQQVHDEQRQFQEKGPLPGQQLPLQTQQRLREQRRLREQQQLQEEEQEKLEEQQELQEQQQLQLQIQQLQQQHLAASRYISEGSGDFSIPQYSNQPAGQQWANYRASEISSLSSGFGDGQFVYDTLNEGVSTMHTTTNTTNTTKSTSSTTASSNKKHGSSNYQTMMAPSTLSSHESAGWLNQRRDTVYTEVSEDSPARFRTVNSWVKQQTSRAKRADQQRQLDDAPPVPKLPPEQDFGLMMPDGEKPRRAESAFGQGASRW